MPGCRLPRLFDEAGPADDAEGSGAEGGITGASEERMGRMRKQGDRVPQGWSRGKGSGVCLWSAEGIARSGYVHEKEAEIGKKEMSGRGLSSAGGWGRLEEKRERVGWVLAVSNRGCMDGSCW